MAWNLRQLCYLREMNVETYSAAVMAQHIVFSTIFFSVIRPIIFGEGMRLKPDSFSNSCYMHKTRAAGGKKGVGFTEVFKGIYVRGGECQQMKMETEV